MNMSSIKARHQGCRLVLFFVSTLLLSSLVACGAKTVSKVAESRGTTPAPGANLPVAECHYVNGASIETTGYVSSYYQFGVYVPDKLNLNLLTIPEGVRNSTEHKLQFFRWTSSPSALNQIAVRLIFVDKVSGQTLNTTTVDSISSSTLSQIIQSKRLDILGYTTNNFFQKAMVVATGIEKQYIGLQARLILTSNGQTYNVGSFDFLIPPFYSNPTTFATYHSALQAMHPFYSYRHSGATDADYTRLSEEVCSQMVHDGGRLPASVEPAGNKFLATLADWLRQAKDFLFALFN